MEEAKDDDEQRLEEQKDVWTTENDSNGNEMNLSSESKTKLLLIETVRYAPPHQH